MMANVFELWIEVFIIITVPIAGFFGFVTSQVVSIFNGIPLIAIDFVFAILTYSTLALLGLMKARTTKATNVIFTILYYTIIISTLLYIIWKTRIVTLLDDKTSADDIATFFINLMYVLLAIGIVFAFYRTEKKRELRGESNRIKTLKTMIKVFIWAMFVLLTYVIAPLFDNFMLTMDTIIQTWLLAAYFGITNSLLIMQQREEVDTE